MRAAAMSSREKEKEIAAGGGGALEANKLWSGEAWMVACGEEEEAARGVAREALLLSSWTVAGRVSSSPD